MEQNMTTGQTRDLEDLKQIVDDLRESKACEDHNHACVVSPSCLERLRNSLAEKDSLNKSVRPEPEKRLINAKQFLAAFRASSDDYHLMSEFSLSPKQLKKIYKALVEKGLLSEYEHYYRQVKALELDEPTDAVLSTSTVVSLIEGLSDETRRMYGAKKPDPERSGPVSRHTGSTQARPQQTRDYGRCPKCGKPKTQSQACIYCGVIFSKFAPKTAAKGIPLWDFDARDR